MHERSSDKLTLRLPPKAAYNSQPEKAVIWVVFPGHENRYPTDTHIDEKWLLGARVLHWDFDLESSRWHHCLPSESQYCILCCYLHTFRPCAGYTLDILCRHKVEVCIVFYIPFERTRWPRRVVHRAPSGSQYYSFCCYLHAFCLHLVSHLSCRLRLHFDSKLRFTLYFPCN